MLFEHEEKVLNIYGENVLAKCLFQNWFAKIIFGNFDIEDTLGSGRIFEADAQNKGID